MKKTFTWASTILTCLLLATACNQENSASSPIAPEENTDTLSVATPDTAVVPAPDTVSTVTAAPDTTASTTVYPGPTPLLELYFRASVS
ncbi:hypothetical protein [Pontibacter rugosus]